MKQKKNRKEKKKIIIKILTKTETNVYFIPIIFSLQNRRNIEQYRMKLFSLCKHVIFQIKC